MVKTASNDPSFFKLAKCVDNKGSGKWTIRMEKSFENFRLIHECGIPNNKIKLRVFDNYLLVYDVDVYNNYNFLKAMKRLPKIKIHED